MNSRQLKKKQKIETKRDLYKKIKALEKEVAELKRPQEPRKIDDQGFDEEWVSNDREMTFRYGVPKINRFKK